MRSLRCQLHALHKTVTASKANSGTKQDHMQLPKPMPPGATQGISLATDAAGTFAASSRSSARQQGFRSQLRAWHCTNGIFQSQHHAQRPSSALIDRAPRSPRAPRSSKGLRAHRPSSALIDRAPRSCPQRAFQDMPHQGSRHRPRTLKPTFNAAVNSHTNPRSNMPTTFPLRPRRRAES